MGLRYVLVRTSWKIYAGRVVIMPIIQFLRICDDKFYGSSQRALIILDFAPFFKGLKAEGVDRGFDI